MGELLSLHDIGIIVLFISSIILILVLKSGFNPIVKWSIKENRYCFYYETIIHTEEIGEEDRYDFALRRVKLPKFLNFLYNDRL